MTEDENEREFKRIMNEERSLDHGVEMLIVISMLALGVACWYELKHQPDIAGAFQWLSNLWH